jgi:hypothetical protein
MNIVEPLYETYTDYIKYMFSINDFSSFKSNPNYTYMLEHVKEYKGYEYLNCIKNNTSISQHQIEQFCKLNDKQGNPTKATFETFSASPTSLRYIWFAHLILTHFKTFNKLSHNFIEIGGGYGGLCFALSFFAPLYGITITSYTIVDLEYPLKLQEQYLTNLPILFPVSFVNATTFGKNIESSNLSLVSTYCFSEISFDFQKEYIEHLFPKIAHGFIAWNNIPTYYFGFDCKEEPEIPNTGHLNKFIYF